MRKLAAILVLVVLITPTVARADGGVDGAAVYKAKCAMCHGPDGKGQTTMGKSMKLRDLGSADVQKQTDAELFKVVAEGKAKMPAYKAKLDQASLDALVTFIRTLKK
jgi:mono/diheme cytochrome c family protein